jgi:hypothetical protein
MKKNPQTSSASNPAQTRTISGKSRAVQLTDSLDPVKRALQRLMNLLQFACSGGVCFGKIVENMVNAN